MYMSGFWWAPVFKHGTVPRADLAVQCATQEPLCRDLVQRLGQRNAKQRRLSSQMMVSSEELYGVHDPIKGNTLDDTWLDLRIGLAPKSDRLQMLPPN